MLKEKLNFLPTNPGCYLMKDKNNDIIYVGKAKNLKNRVKSYFTGAHNIKTTKLVSEIKDFDYVVTNSEQESLILELNLIKKHRPKYNIVFMDDKTYPFIQITDDIPPEIKVVRRKNVKGKIFGPYPNVKSARETARLLQLLFPMGRKEAIPNLYEDIGYKIIPKSESKNYDLYIEKITKFLKGDISEVVNALEEEMEKASANLLFERAAVLRDKIDHIKTTTEKQIISLNDFKDRDIISIYYNNEDVSLQILFMRNGRIIDQHQRIMSYVGNPVDFILTYLGQFYESYQPDELLFDNMFSEEILKQIFGDNAYIPKIGDKRKIVKLAHKNAEIDLKHHEKIYRDKYEVINNQIELLKEVLNLNRLNKIEIFDNSQLFGTSPISAMVVFENSKWSRKLYRKYHLKTTKNDDYQAMKEVIYRRYRRLLMEKKSFPDLILVDGGKGQVNAALSALNDLEIKIPVAGLKKDDYHRLESLIYNNKEIDINNELKKLLMMFSEEVHRFAISFHRRTRLKTTTSSKLDEVKGLGPKRKMLLYKNFNSIEEIRDATEEELLKIGIPKSVIKGIKDVLK